MNNFKYQKKIKPSEETINSFRDFKKVLKKHNAISSAYKTILKYSIISTAAAGSLIAAYFFYPKSENQKSEEYSTILSNPIKQKSQENTHQKSIDKIEYKPNITSKTTSTNNSEKESNTAVSSISVDKEERLSIPNNQEKPLNNDEEEIKSTNKLSKTYQVADNDNEEIKAWYTLNEKPKEEIIRLPTLLVSNIAWPKRMKKAKLINSPSIKMVYQSINQEIPIVNGMAYITTSTSIEKPAGHKLNGNFFPPGLIREIHKTSKSCILLLKDVEILIPGRGKINIGDREIKINTDNHYIN